MKIIKITHETLYARKALIDQPVAIAAGMFDGMHKGHKSLILKTKAVAREHGMQSGVLSISTKPAEMFVKTNVHLMREEDKAAFLAANGIDYLFMIEFSNEIKNIEALDFLEMLTAILPIRYYLTGSNYHFGKHAAGDVAFLQKYAQSLGFEALTVETIAASDHIISSSTIKQYIRSGEIEAANELLGYPYQISGEVIHGEKKGRIFGFPTINMSGEIAYIVPPTGIYATKVTVDGKEYIGLTNIGTSPTVKNNSPILIETSIVDFSGDLYGKIIPVRFYKKIRDEQKFASLELLLEQMNKDKATIINYFQNDCH